VCEQGLLSCEDLNDVPFLILGNKIDLGRAASEDELRIQVLVTPLIASDCL
jgi:GTPase SAR1 family protein